VVSGTRRFTERLSGQVRMRLVAVAASKRRQSGDQARARSEEAERLIRAAGDAVRVALDENGRQWTTRQLASRLDDWLMDGRDVAFLIGGADGLDADLIQRADHRLSLSALTFPHRLVRVIVAEQLYRAWTLLNDHPYHRD